MENTYAYWNSEEAVKKYSAPRLWEKRFRSERFFLEKVMKPGMSVLDVGCATGDLYYALKEKYGVLRYTGVDVAPNMIAEARTLFPEAGEKTFMTGNILDMQSPVAGSRYDVVTATGVFQHESRSQELLHALVDNTKEGGYILFDVKLFHSHPKLCDITRAYVDHPSPLHFIVFNLKDIFSMISEETAAGSHVGIFGYYSGTHPSVRLPASVEEQVLSAHVLLRRGLTTDDRQQMNVEMDLPSDFISRCFKELPSA